MRLIIKIDRIAGGGKFHGRKKKKQNKRGERERKRKRGRASLQTNVSKKASLIR